MRASSKNSDLIRKRKLRLYIGAYKMVAIFIVVFILIIVGVKNYRTFVRYFHEAFIEYSADFGFKLKNIAIEGQKNLDVRKILSQLDADNNTPLFAIDLVATKEILEQNDWVARAIVARKLPNTIKINLLERTPMAIWQYNMELFLIDAKGVKICADVSKFADLPLVVGNGANYYAPELLDAIVAKPKILQQLQSSTRVANRRWNLHLKNGCIIKLPAKNSLKALDYLEIQMQKGIDLSVLKVLDLRDEEKYYVEK